MKKNYRIMKDMHPDRSCARVPGCPMQTVVRRGTSFHRQYFVYRISYIEVLNKTFGVKRSAFGEKVQPHRFFRFFCFSPFTFHRLLFTAFIQRVCQGQPGTLAYSLRFFLLLMVLLSFILFPAASAYSLDPNALPTGGQIVSGAGNISQSGNSMTVNQATDRMIANWNTFNIGQDASVTFRQPGASSVALNRILDQNPSLIYGRLSANGQVFLLNAAGVYFSPTSRVDVGGLVASSLNITNENFLAGRYSFEHAGGAGSIMNQGDIRAADGGYIAFLSPHITNEGTITAQNGTIAMTSGDRVNLDFTGDSLVSFTVEKGAVDALIENRGLIRADGGAVLLTAKAADALTTAVVNNEGIIEAHTLANRSGRILLLSDGEAIAGGTLDASAPDGGDGGFIETSGKKVTIEDTLSVTTSAPYGKIGTWLIDPENDYKIAPSGGDITGSQLSSDLGSNNVTILSSSGGTAGNGDIFVNDNITWSANKLALNAYRNIKINSALFGSGTAQLFLLYGQGAIAAGNTATYTVNAPVNLPAGNNFFTTLGSDGVQKTYTVITSLGSAGSTTAIDLQGIAGNLGGYYALGASIDASATSGWNAGAGFLPIGDSTTNFTGAFNGLGHTISDLFINRPSTDYVGLFGYIGTGAAVSNVGMAGGSVKGGVSVGGLVGYNDGTITNSYATGSVTGGVYAGGLVGLNYSTITNSYWDKETSGQSSSDGGTGLSTAQMMQSGSFSGWDFTNTWWISNGNTRPFLRMEYSTTITNAHQLQLIGMNATTLAASYTLAADIDMAELSQASSLWNTATGFLPIGNSTTQFTGAFDGLGHTISDLTINRSSTNYVGLFGYIGSGGSVSNVGMVGGSVRGTSYVGGLVGYNAGDTVTNSYSTGSVAGVGYVGGLVGYNAGTITDSYATGKVVGDMPAGGLVGRNTGTITDSYATGAVEGDYLLGSYNGGLVGTNSGTITDSYATGAVEGRYTGGLVAANAGTGTITNSFWDTQTSGQSSSAGGTGKTSAEMKQLATFSAWDIDNTEGTGKTWRIYDGYTYPLLRYFLTTATATVDNTSMVYNGSTTVAGGSYTWDIAVDTSKIYGTASYTASSKNVGNRILSLSGLYSNQQGYDIKIIDGKVNITAKDLTASYTGNNKVYDATTTATVTGSSGDIIGGDTVTFSQTASFIDKNVGTGKTINISGITLGGIDAGNYSLLNTTAATTADITKAALTVTANDDNKIYSGVPYSGGNGVTYTGFAGGETQAVLGGTLQYSGTSQGAINVGAYGIDPFGLTSGNYAISFASGVLTIGGSSWTSMESVSSVLTCTLNTSNGTATLIGALNTTGGTQEGQGGYPGTHDILFMGPGTGGTTLTNFINTALVGP